jgi:hypothetical protein
MVKEKTLRPVSVMETHFYTHIDEEAARMAEEEVAGTKINLHFHMNANTATSEEKERMIGAGGGAMDEHINGGCGRGEKSAFAIRIKQLGIAEEYRAKRLAEFVNRVDSAQHSDPFDLSKILQAIHRNNPGSSAEGSVWASEVLHNYWNDENYFRRPAKECGIWFEKVAAIWLRNKFGERIDELTKEIFSKGKEISFAKTLEGLIISDENQKKALREMARYFENGCEKMLMPFALPRALYSVHNLKGIRTAIKLARIALDAKLCAEEAILAAGNEKGEQFQAGKFTVFAIKNNTSRHIKDDKLKNCPEISVIMQKSSFTKQVQIFSRTSSGVNFEKLAKAIRLEELELAEKPTYELFDEELEAGGNTCGVDNWHFLKPKIENGKRIGTYALLNGSDTYLAVPATTISWERLKELVTENL